MGVALVTKLYHRWQKAEKQQDLFDWFIQPSLVLNSLGGRDTHTNRHTDFPDKSNFKKPGADLRYDVCTSITHVHKNVLYVALPVEHTLTA